MAGHKQLITEERREREFTPEPGFVVACPLESVEQTSSLLTSCLAEGRRNPAGVKQGKLVAEVFVNICHTTNIITPMVVDRKSGEEREIKKDAKDKDWENASCSVSYGERCVDKKNRVIVIYFTIQIQMQVDCFRKLLPLCHFKFWLGRFYAVDKRACESINRIAPARK